MYIISSIGEYSSSNHTELDKTTPSYKELSAAREIFYSIYKEERNKSVLHPSKFNNLWRHYIERIEQEKNTNQAKR